ncbi:hypothetical protein F751_0962 [Auxenochlorella protothecoides]|uniref:Folate receptor-like domain-containing protein n=1 Tax=Auxenochlorella protothecoides TaxID=3075 RepID=A0A087SQZ3_AUXPR|nr:hypothetical protein F751_0962 [Auxenochlorella protothecoides]KFM28147.1 hypothetical protein F751_0962 [Auxenochlorella protothecoides]
MKATLPLLLLLVVLAPVVLGKGDDSITTEVTILSSTCLSLLDQVMASYTNAVEPYTAGGCNTTCLKECHQVVLDGIYATYHQDCPEQSQLVYCFNRFPATWAQYATLCGLFSLQDTTAEASAEAAALAEPSVYNASRSVAWSAPSVYDTNLRRLMALTAEAESEGGNVGCFPAFNDIDSFRVWMSGEYWSNIYSPPSNAGGIAVSVVFWVALVALGFSTKG